MIEEMIEKGIHFSGARTYSEIGDTENGYPWISSILGLFSRHGASVVLCTVVTYLKRNRCQVTTE
ncbi:hypothetical protein SERLA73DRAFT_183842 [Serpula lacrymans var. lacrymans S7.3]|uniref:Uncharacterized protein n=2 Tax=Serpula lacrymans var. lacrymans TaxID=341189 RepID=F8Q1X7_SERL3|nr:uncharacterized protein SERLADRAFT_471231 [Serpula lacrymans var. lacrymans S7.9]EGN97188.1 hypothetical protein SERLA73DRAFT_183842 [Serpula lacrymans var. lacrymans S7.3]EGO22796.1 hypothetical protein SERLADRAFT_471231 [Serpula lacrymans var. lacrymans S7.9]